MERRSENNDTARDSLETEQRTRGTNRAEWSPGRCSAGLRAQSTTHGTACDSTSRESIRQVMACHVPPAAVIGRRGALVRPATTPDLVYTSRRTGHGHWAKMLAFCFAFLSADLPSCHRQAKSRMPWGIPSWAVISCMSCHVSFELLPGSQILRARTWGSDLQGCKRPLGRGRQLRRLWGSMIGELSWVWALGSPQHIPQVHQQAILLSPANPTLPRF